MAGNQRVTTENINEVILRLLKLNPGTEIDYQTYAGIIKKKLASVRMVGSFIPAEEDKLLREEFKRVRNKEGRFAVKGKKTRVSVAPNGPGPETDGGSDGPNGGKIVKSPSGKITADKFFFENFINPVKVKDITEKTTKVSRKSSDCCELLQSPLDRINNNLDSIIKTLTDINKENKKKTEKERRESESQKRKNREKELESKTFDGIKNVIKGILKPFQSIWEKILNFITNIILGRIAIKLINWIADPKNQGKIQSVIRFFKDHWPTLLALYLRFGTGIGRFIGRLGGILIKGAFKLGKLAFQLAAKAGIKRAGKFAAFLGGPRARAIATGVGIAADIAVTAGTAIGIEKLMGGEEKSPPVQQFSGGGTVRYPKFAGGGFANFGKMFGGAAMGAGLGSMFGPLGMLLGAGLGGVAGSGMFNGLVKGQKGKDKIPAMLSDGEFVMSTGAVRKYGIDTLESMNAAGGGTNIPQIAKGITYAAGGGFIGDAVAAQDAWSNYMKANPEKFAKGGSYGDFESVNRASRDFMRTFMKSGKPPEWANIKQKTTRVQTPESSRSSTYQEPYTRRTQTSGSSWWDDWKTNFTKQSTPPNTPKPPTSSAITKSTGALSTEVRTVRPKVRGYGGALQAAFAAMEFNDRKQSGQTNAQAGLGAAGSTLGGSVGWMAGAKAGALLGGAIGTMFGGVGAAPGAAVGAIIGGIAGGFGGASLGGKLADDLSGVNAAKEKLSRGGIGGAVKGGYGLKKQEFKDAPKTMVMTDDKGRPFVGHKAMKNGKLTYVRPSKPGTGTTNPLEMLGRAINPGAYKDNDARLAMKNQKIAMVNALESFQRQGMVPDAQARMMKQMGGNLKDVQNDLNYRRKTEQKQKEEQKRLISGNDKMSVMRRNNAARLASQQKTRPNIKPLPKPKPRSKPIGTGGDGITKSRGGASSINTSKPRTQNPTHSSSSTRTARATLGINKK